MSPNPATNTPASDETKADPIRCAIVDDEPMGRSSVRYALAKDPEVEVVGEASDGDAAIALIRRELPDVVFLDVHMPGLSGLEVLQALRPEERPLVVFATAYDHYAVKAFDENAVDYLLKPFDDRRLAQALEKVKGHLRREQSGQANDRISKLLADLAPKGAKSTVAASAAAAAAPTDAVPPDRIVIHREGALQIVPVADIRFVQAADQYVELFTDKGPQLMRESMSNMEQSLDRTRFMRIHRSYIVALDQVRLMESKPGGTARVKLVDGRWLPVARTRVPALRKRIG